MSIEEVLKILKKDGREMEQKDREEIFLHACGNVCGACGACGACRVCGGGRKSKRYE